MPRPVFMAVFFAGQPAEAFKAQGLIETEGDETALTDLLESMPLVGNSSAFGIVLP